jgi:hypothetical protein
MTKLKGVGFGTHPYRAWSYEQLRSLVDAPKRTVERVGESGARYYLDVYAVWEGKRNGAIRVIGAIDDGGWRAFVPLTVAFVREPDGSAWDA